MDAAGQLAQVLQGLLRLGLRLGQRLPGDRGVAGELVAGQAQLGRQGHDLLLGPVVQVAFQVAAGLVGGGYQPLP